MHVTLVHINVKPEHVDDFIRATHANHTASVQEDGNPRFDVLQRADAPTHFVLYEAYASEAAAAVHKQTAHYLHWREVVAGWMAEPREGVAYQGLLP